VKMTGADFAMQTQNVSSATVFARKDIMEMANRAKETCAIPIHAKMELRVSQLTPLTTAIAFSDGLDHTVKPDNTAFPILARMEEPVFRRKMVTNVIV